MAHREVDDASLTSVADAIRSKGGTSDALVFPDGFVSAIDAIQAIQTDGVAAEFNDVNFVDYDGTLVASYTLAGIKTLTALPDGPAHDGLIFRGWNWTLEDIQALNRPVDVGAMYITDDGKTRLYIRIAAEGRMTVPLYISQTVAYGVTIDWGDGSAPETLAGTGYVNTAHTYAAIGDYVITLDAADGCMLGFGGGVSGYCVMGPTGNNGLVYCNMLRAVEIGSNVTAIDAYAFDHCFSLACIAIPDSLTSIGKYSFQLCYDLLCIVIPCNATVNAAVFMSAHSLRHISVPNGIADINNYICNGSCVLCRITIPDSVTSIGSYTFQNSNSLAEITIPAGVKSIGSNAFNYCYGMAAYHLRPTTPPTLGNTTAFGGIPDDCIIYVPQGCLDAYQTATNWASFADYMREEA